MHSERTPPPVNSPGDVVVTRMEPEVASPSASRVLNVATVISPKLLLATQGEMPLSNAPFRSRF
jgi:hypothetical protein